MKSICLLLALSLTPAYSTSILLADYTNAAPAAGVANFSATVNTGAQGSFSYLYAAESTTTPGTVTPFITLGTGASLDPDDPVLGNGLDQSTLVLFTQTVGANYRFATGPSGSQGAPFNFLNLNQTALHPGSGNSGPIVQYTLDSSDLAAGSSLQIGYDLNNTNSNGNGIELVVFVNNVASHISATTDGAPVAGSFIFDSSSLAAGDTVSLWFNNLGSNGADATEINSLTITAVPELSSTLLLGLTSLCIAFRRKR